MSLGYPGVKGVVLPAAGTVSKVSLAEDRPYLCVSYDKEEDFYQPMRLVNTIFVGPVLMAASTKLENPVLKGVTALSGLFLMVGSGVRYYEAYEEMTRYNGELESGKGPAGSGPVGE
jgi:hypothetical protein